MTTVSFESPKDGRFHADTKCLKLPRHVEMSQSINNNPQYPNDNIQTNHTPIKSTFLSKQFILSKSPTLPKASFRPPSNHNYSTILPHHTSPQRLRRHTDLAISHLDICATEFFVPKCSLNHVIFVKSALYGRIEESRCVANFLDQLGCYSDVVLLMDRVCSGKRSCEIHVPNAELESNNPCLKELKSFLRFNYECVLGELMFRDF